MFRSLVTTATVAIFALTFASHASAQCAAIAYSQSTGHYGYSYGYYEKTDAELVALGHCGSQDARVVVWSQSGWCSLAVGDGNAYGWGWAGSQYEAECLALTNCSKYAKNAHIAVSVFSGSY